MARKAQRSAESQELLDRRGRYRSALELVLSEVYGDEFTGRREDGDGLNGPPGAKDEHQPSSGRSAGAGSQ
jgi:hypothetical protein